MRIGLVTDGIYPFVVGGMQKHSYYLAKYFAKNGVYVDLYQFQRFNLNKTKEDVFGEDSDKIEFIVLDFPEKTKLPFHYIRESKEFSEIIYKSFKTRPRPDLLICKGFTGWEFIKRKLAGEKLPPICVNFHGYEMFQRTFSLREKIIQYVLRRPVRYISKNADYVFSYGGKITGIIRSEFNTDQKKILEFPAGIEPEWLNQDIAAPGKTIQFVFAGRYEARKGLSELNVALQKFFNNKNWHFHFVGDIPSAMKIDSEQVTYHGLITDHNKIKEIFYSCDVLVCPSWSEGMPNVIVEGMASGLAVLATDVGATSKLVNENTGWLMDNPSVELIEKNLDSILNTSREDILQKKINARKHIEQNFLWSEISKDLLKKISEIIDGR